MYPMTKMKMMSQRTLNIIYICKHPYHKYWDNANSRTDAIKNYMADECGIRARWYSYRAILDIMWTAMLDYLDHCDMPSEFMWQLHNVIGVAPDNVPERIAVALALVRVKFDGNYVNGFDDRLYALDREEHK